MVKNCKGSIYHFMILYADRIILALALKIVQGTLESHAKMPRKCLCTLLISSGSGPTFMKVIIFPCDFLLR